MIEQRFTQGEHSTGCLDNDMAPGGALLRRLSCAPADELLWGLLAFIALEAIFATVVRNLDAAQVSAAIQYSCGAAACVAAMLFAPLVASRMRVLTRFLAPLSAVTPGLLLAGLILLGCALRIAWDLLFPSVPVSDSSTYLILARKLHSGEAYATADTRAFWPPGYPFYLTGVFAVFGDSASGILFSNLVLYVVTLVATYGLTLRLCGSISAKMAALLLAIWPNHVMLAGQATKEYLLLPLLLLVVYCCHVATRASGSSARIAAAGAGVLLGLSILVQPSLNLLACPLALLLFWASPKRQTLVTLVALLVSALVPIVPWTVRNYRVFGEVVPLTTSGGSNLYRANNDLATGGYTDFGKRSLTQFDELTANRRGFEYAKEWIAHNPLLFARLVLAKQIRFLGDDSVGPYGSMKWGPARPVPAWQYAVAKAVSNIYWMGIWLAVLISILVVRKRDVKVFRGLFFAAAPILYLYGIHSVFESDGKYHFGVIGLIAVLAVAGLATEQSRSFHDAGSPQDA